MIGGRGYPRGYQASSARSYFVVNTCPPAMLRFPAPLQTVERQSQFGGAYAGEEGQRRAAFNVMLSMKRRPIHSSFKGRARVRRPSNRHGAARPPGRSARAPERQRGVEARPAAQSWEGRPAPLARDLRRATARAGIVAEATRQAARGGAAPSIEAPAHRERVQLTADRTRDGPEMER